MQDGSRVRLNLSSYRQVNGITFYQIEMHVQGEIHIWEQRYSVLKDICQQFPNTTVKFPPKNSLRHALSQITGSEEFLLERFNFMKEYFDSFNSNSDLRFNKAFMQIYRHLQLKKNNTPKINTFEKAPVIKGKKLQSKPLNQKDLYIIV